MIDNNILMVSAMRKLRSDIEILSEIYSPHNIEMVALGFVSIWGLMELMGILAEAMAEVKNKELKIKREVSK